MTHLLKQAISSVPVDSELLLTRSMAFNVFSLSTPTAAIPVLALAESRIRAEHNLPRWNAIVQALSREMAPAA